MINLDKRRQQISAILAEIEAEACAQRHMPETDAYEAWEIIDRIEHKLFPAGMPR